MRAFCLIACFLVLAAFRGRAAEELGADGTSPSSAEPDGGRIGSAVGETSKESARPSLKQTLAELKVPPEWFNTVTTSYDTSKPWKKARLEIRRLLGLGGEPARQAIKLTCAYVQKKDIGDGHEYPMYLFLGGEYAWALVQYEKRLSPKPEGRTHEYLSLASCYAHFGEYKKALAVLDVALKRLPKPPWKIAREADVHSHVGDLFAARLSSPKSEMGDAARAKKHYQKAIKLYPTSKQPWGRHLLKKQAAQVRAKLDLLAYRPLGSVPRDALPDGTYAGSSLGYKGDVKVKVALRGGRIAHISVEHKEDIEQNATKIVPQRIIETQSLKVDAITGATATSNAVIAATFKALKKAGLEK